MFQIALQHTERLSTQHWLKSPFLSKDNNIQSPLIISKNHNGYQSEGQNKSCSTRIIQKKGHAGPKNKLLSISVPGLYVDSVVICAALAPRDNRLWCERHINWIEEEKRRPDYVLRLIRNGGFAWKSWLRDSDNLSIRNFGTAYNHYLFFFFVLKTVQKIKKRGYILHR